MHSHPSGSLSLNSHRIGLYGRGMLTKPLTLDQIAKGAYLFLASDQWDDGMWARSLSLRQDQRWGGQDGTDDRAAPTHGSRSATGRPRKSVTLTYFAASAIHEYTRDRANPCIQTALSAVAGRPYECGAYGSVFPESDTRHSERKVFVPNARHTATAGLLFAAFGSDNARLSEMSAFLASPREGGPWGERSGSRDPDCLSTAYSLAFLDNCRRKPGVGTQAVHDTADIEAAMARGLQWLAADAAARDDLWDLWGREAGEPVYKTATILCVLPSLVELDLALYRRTLAKLKSLQNADGGWPAAPGDRSSMGSTVWVSLALVKSQTQDVDRLVANGIDLIAAELAEPAVSSCLVTADWAALLELAARRGLHPSASEDVQVRRRAKQFVESALRSNSTDHQLLVLGPELQFVREPLRGLLAGTAPPGPRARTLWISRLRLGTVVLLGALSVLSLALKWGPWPFFAPVGAAVLTVLLTVVLQRLLDRRDGRR